MGSGKSTIGRLLSNELKLEFIDSDKVIVDRAGADIPWIFDVEGEEGFRDREQTVIDLITQQDDIVLATGGGAVMRPSNREFLRSRGLLSILKPVSISRLSEPHVIATVHYCKHKILVKR